MSRLRRIGGAVALWLLLCALLPLHGERLSDVSYLETLVVAGAVLAGAVGIRRIAPLAALVTAAGLLVVDFWLAGPFAVVAFLVGRSPTPPRPTLWTFGGVAIGGAALAFARAVVFGGDRWVAYYLVAEVVFCGIFPWLAGRYLRQRRELAAGGWALAEELERGQALVAEQARLRERTRIAEDMHDALGHELSLLALRAGALELDTSLAPDQRAAAGELRAGAAAATERLRAAIGVLRAGAQAPLRPAEESVSTLVDRVRQAGLRLDWHVVSPSGPDVTGNEIPPLPSLVDRALHRTVQEGLTNALRHAPRTEVTGRLTISPTTVTVVLSNPLPAEESGERGSGLVGLAERVRLAGGTLSTAAADGRFTLTATLPRDERPALAPAAIGTTSDRRRAGARRRTRRDLALLVAVPTLAALVLVGGVIGGYAVETKGSVLTPADAATLRIGRPEDAVRAELPWLEVTERPQVSEPARPPGAKCSYYGTSGKLFPPVRDVYRVCFAHQRLASVDLIRGRTARGARG